MKRKKWNKISLEDYYRVKKMTALNIPASTISKLVGYSVGTISRINKSAGYVDYHDQIKQEWYQRNGKKAVEKPVEFPPKEPIDWHEVVKLLKEIKESLERIDLAR